MSDSFSRSLLKVGGGVEAGKRRKGRTGSRELRREDLEGDGGREKLQVFIRWKEYVKQRREAWDLLSDDFHLLQTTYERLLRHQTALQRKEHLSQIFSAWAQSIQPPSIPHWKYTNKVIAWHLFKKWKEFTLSRTKLRKIHCKIQEKCKQNAKKEIWDLWNRKITQKNAVKLYFKRYFLEKTTKFAFYRIKKYTKILTKREISLNRLKFRINSRKLQKILQNWKFHLKNRKNALIFFFRFSRKLDKLSLFSSFSLWKQPIFHLTRLFRVLKLRKVSLLRDSFHSLHISTLKSSILFLKEELVSLPPRLEASFYSSCEERINQIRLDLERDKERFEEERRYWVRRQQELKTAVSSQASVVYEQTNVAREG